MQQTEQYLDAMQGPEQPSQVRTPAHLEPAPTQPVADEGAVAAPQPTGPLAPPAGHQWQAKHGIC
jgi:hypothetical protein